MKSTIKNRNLRDCKKYLSKYRLKDKYNSTFESTIKYFFRLLDKVLKFSAKEDRNYWQNFKDS